MCLYYILLLFISPLPVLLVKNKIGFIINLIIYTFFIVSMDAGIHLSDLLGIQKGSGTNMEFIYFNIFGFLNSSYHPDLIPIWVCLFWLGSILHGNLCLSEPNFINNKEYHIERWRKENPDNKDLSDEEIFRIVFKSWKKNHKLIGFLKEFIDIGSQNELLDDVNNVKNMFNKNDTKYKLELINNAYKDGLLSEEEYNDKIKDLENWKLKIFTKDDLK